MTRAIPDALKAHYALGTTTLATCWKATLRDGTVITATTHSERLEFPPASGGWYEPTQGYNPSDIEHGSDLSYDNLEVDGYLASPSITASDVQSGRWDYAAIELFEVNVADLTQGRNLLRSGTLGQVRAGRSTFHAELRGLTQAYSRRIVQLTTQECIADLGDARCKVDLAPLTVTAAVDSVTANKTIHAALAQAADWFTGCKLTFTSGLNDGLSMEVKNYTPGVLELFEAMPFPVAASDTFTVYRGCQKRFYEDCIGVHNNGVNFRGFPHVPGVGIFGGPGTNLTPATVPSP